MDSALVSIGIAKFLFWTTVLALLTPTVVYPLSLLALARFRKPIVEVTSSLSGISLVISAFNEEAVIGAKLRNSLELDYPAERIEIVVISDASTDATNEIVESFSGQGIRLCVQENRLGKSAGLTRFCPTCRGEIIVFTDANSIFKKDALRKLVRYFGDAGVGYTVGKQLYVSADHSSSKSESAYWSFEHFMKEHESRLSSVVGADGAIYAMRKSLFEPLADDDISDFILPLKMVAAGKRGVFEPEAICYEQAAPSFKSEFHRKSRIVNRSLSAVLRTPQAMNPFRVGIFAYQLICHKLLRWLSPIFWMVATLTSAILVANRETQYSIFLTFELALFSLAALYMFPVFRKLRIVYLAFYYLVVNTAAFIGICLTLSRKTISTWEPQR